MVVGHVTKPSCVQVDATPDTVDVAFYFHQRTEIKWQLSHILRVDEEGSFTELHPITLLQLVDLQTWNYNCQQVTSARHTISLGEWLWSDLPLVRQIAHWPNLP